MEQKFKEWTIKKCIGKGTFGKVYLIEKEEFGHTYRAALKMMEIPKDPADVKLVRNEGMSEKNVTAYFYGMTKRIVDEYAVMARLKGHSNIVSCEDHLVVKKKDAFGWIIFIRMELLTPLYDYIRKHKFTVSQVVKLGIDICSALEVCQKYNIIHRDIKPENIFVSEWGDFKLGDFGIARELEHTSSGLSRVGTKSYIAPEVYKGDAYNSQVDLYSLGLVMYRLLNGNRMPFMPPAPEKIRFSDREKAEMMRLSGQPLEKPCHAKGVLAEIILKACAYLPEDRFESAADMKHALQNMTKGTSSPSGAPAPFDTEMSEKKQSGEKQEDKEQIPESQESEGHVNAGIRKKSNILWAAALGLACICIVMLTILFSDAAQTEKSENYGISKGQTVYFGSYWQEDTNGDGKADSADDKQPILWKVLSVNGEDALILAEKNLNCMKYQKTDQETTWEACGIRKWLNEEFFQDAFSEEERKAVLKTEVTNEAVRNTSAKSGKTTTDKLFLLSIYEAYDIAYGFEEKRISASRRTTDTSYTRESGAGLEDSSAYVSADGDWWLRTPGNTNQEACIIGTNGDVYYADVNCSDIGVRPALHINLSKLARRKGH